jgi:hypothetical protein
LGSEEPHREQTGDCGSQEQQVPGHGAFTRSSPAPGPGSTVVDLLFTQLGPLLARSLDEFSGGHEEILLIESRVPDARSANRRNALA